MQFSPNCFSTIRAGNGVPKKCWMIPRHIFTASNAHVCVVTVIVSPVKFIRLRSVRRVPLKLLLRLRTTAIWEVTWPPWRSHFICVWSGINGHISIFSFCFSPLGNPRWCFQRRAQSPIGFGPVSVWPYSSIMSLQWGRKILFEALVSQLFYSPPAIFQDETRTSSLLFLFKCIAGELHEE